MKANSMNELLPIIEEAIKQIQDHFGNRLKSNNREIENRRVLSNESGRVLIKFKIHGGSIWDNTKLHSRIHLTNSYNNISWTSIKKGKDYSDFIQKVEQEIAKDEKYKEIESKQDNALAKAKQTLVSNQIDVEWNANRQSGIRPSFTYNDKHENYFPAIEIEARFSTKDNIDTALLQKLIDNSIEKGITMHITVPMTSIDLVKEYYEQE